MKNHDYSLTRRFLDPAAAGRALLLIHLVLSPLLFSRAAAESFEQVKVWLLIFTAILLGALGLSVWIGKAASLGVRAALGGTVGEGLRRLGREPIACGVLLFCTSAVVSTLFSICPRTSWQGAPGSECGIVTFLSYTVLFFATRRLCRDAEDCRRLLSAAVLGSAVAATYALLQAVHLDPLAWHNVSNLDAYVRPFGTMSHPNFLAAYLVMAFPILLYFADRAAAQRQWLPALVFGVVGMLSCLVIILANSRGAWLAFVCVLGALGIGWYRLGKGGRLLTLAVGIVVLAGLGFAGVCAALPQGRELLATVEKRAGQLCEGSSRFQIWRAALGIFRDHPPVGSGLDTFHLAFGKERTPAYGMMEWKVTPKKAHNEALHILATQGLLGAAGGLLLTFGLILTWVRVWRRAGPEVRLLLLTLAAGLLGCYVQNIFSFTVAGCGTLFVTCAALLSRLGRADILRQVSPSPLMGEGWGGGDLPAKFPLHPSPPPQGGREKISEPRRHLLALLTANLLAVLALFHNVGPASGGAATAFALIVLGVVVGVTLALFSLEKRARSLPAEQCNDFPKPDPFLTSPSWIGRLLQAGVWGLAGVLMMVLVGTPLRASLACRRGDLLLAESPQAALMYYEQAAAISPGNAYYWSKVGAGAHAWMQRTRNPEECETLLWRSRRAFERAIAQVPLHSYYHAALARTLADMARRRLTTSAEAFAEYDRALALDRNNASYYADSANAAVVLGDLMRAKVYTARGLELYPHFGLLRAHLGYIAMMEKRYADAAHHLEESLAENWHGDESSCHFAAKMMAFARGKIEK